MLLHTLAPIHPPAAAGLGLRRVLPEGEMGVAVTFDDGPHPQGTLAMLEILARAGAKATFFMVGEQVERRAALAAEVLAAGHGIALHGHRHRLQLRLSPRVVAEDLDRGIEAVVRATGVKPVLHRPPYGIYSRAGLAAARARGLEPLLWSRWGKDWRARTTPERIALRAASGVRPADVILLHDADFYSARGSHERTAEALGLILGQLRTRQLATVLAV